MVLNQADSHASQVLSAVQAYLTWVQYSKYMPKFVYMSLVKTLHMSVSTGVGEMLDSYEEDDSILEETTQKYENLTSDR